MSVMENGESGLRNYGIRKIDTRIGLTPETYLKIQARAKRHGVTEANEIRRIIDWFFDSEERSKNERIVVLDREQQMLRSAR